MNCPKCDSSMAAIDNPSFNAMKCSGCAGIWFKDASHEIAKSIKGIGEIDNTEATASTELNALRDIDCPECKRKMLKMADRTQLHIKFEACTDCYGVFFDAGEFKDLTEFTVKQRIRQAISAFKTNTGLR
ncbi:MAG: hypothetical protein DHS20C12_28840 [Pseudohongiella sp.]|nr:MAG: hypothetical protein DHS20C12_28840 [Pseudohongiella sp.]